MSDRRVDVSHGPAHGIGLAFLPAVAFWLLVALAVMVLAS